MNTNINVRVRDNATGRTVEKLTRENQTLPYFVCNASNTPAPTVIIDNLWRHAPDQQITFDERGIINNVLSVTVEACGEPTCFCSRIFGNATTNALDTATTKARNMQLRKGIMTPQTMKRFQRRIGVASYYVEHDIGKSYQFRKGYMHTEISDRPFDVTVVNVNNIKGRLVSVYKPTEGTISRASSFEHIILEQDAARLDPDVPVVEDAAYAAVLNDQDGSLPHTAPNRAYALSGDPTELAYSLRARLSSPVLGFNPKECHEGIRLLDTNHCAVRVQERGLYKSVRCVLPLRTDRRRMYYEFFVLRQSTGGGVCLGLATQELPLNCLCGTRPNSIGFCTSGSLIRTVDGKETWTAFGSDVGSGSTVGCLVGLEKVRFESKTIIKANVQFFVDGNSRGNVDHEFVGDLDIYPTLSLFAKNTRVYLFNGPDMLFASCLRIDEDIVTLDNQKIVRDAGNNPQSLSLANQAKKTDSPVSGESETT